MKKVFGDLKISGKLLLIPIVIILFMMIPSVAAFIGLYQQKGGVDSVLYLLAALFGVSVFLSLLVSFLFLNKRIISPLKAMEIAAGKISEGDLSFDVEVSDRDEIGRLSVHLRESFEELGRILQRIKELSERISRVVEEVERESKNVLNGAENETEAIADISTSIEELNSTATEIADNTESLAASTGETSVSVEQMVRSISSIDGHIQDLSKEVESTSSSIEELSSTIKDVASNAVDLATAAEATLSSISEITVGIREVEDNIKESARLSEKVTSDAATFGMASIEKTIQGMKNIQSSVEHTAQFIEVLGKRSDEIGKILNVIDEITDQTTLLALNAAILAAQAGEHGKGFSVVADEIKDLAERTSLSTKEIVSLIESVQEGVTNASGAMGKGITSVQEGFMLAQEAGDSLKKILDSSRISSEMALSIERSTVEQARAAHLVTEAMEGVRDMSDHIAKATAEQSKSALMIMNAAEKMKDASRQVNKATGEQAASSKQITGAIELVADRSRQISRSLSEHKKGSKSILSSIERVKDIPKENRTLIFRISNTLRDLQKDSELLRTEMERFRFHEKRGTILKFGVIPLESPAEMFRRFSPLVNYLGRKIGKRVELKVGVNFEGAIDDIGKNVTQLCFMGAPTYLKAYSRYGSVKVIARALRKGRPYHHAAIITKADSDIASLKDLKGRTFAFANIISTAGHIIPRTMLKGAGIGIDDLKYYSFLGHHDDAARAVLKGDFDAGSVMEATAYKFIDQGLKIVQLSDDIPEFGVCCNVSLDEKEVRIIQQALVAINDSTPEGAAIVKSIDKNYTGFIEADDSEYSDIKLKMVEFGIL